MQRTRTTFFLAAAILVVSFLPAHAQTKWAVIKTAHVGGEGGWDYIFVDSTNRRLFVTRNTYTQVISTTTGKVIANIPGQIRSHGIAIVPAVNRGFITDGGGSGAIDVFDLNTYKLLGKIHTMPDSDGIIYDRFANLVLAVSGDEGKLMAFTPHTDITAGKFKTIDLGGAPEYLAADEDSKVYVNLANKNLVAVVDLKSNKVVARWSVAPGGVPEGMAIDQRDHVLLIGCRNPQKLIVMDTRTGKVLAALPIGSLVDATGYTAGQAFASCGGTGELFVASLKRGIWQLDQVVKTAVGARTMDIDRQSQTVFLPTARLGSPVRGKRDPQIEPGTFMLVEVGRH